MAPGVPRWFSSKALPCRHPYGTPRSLSSGKSCAAAASRPDFRFRLSCQRSSARPGLCSLRPALRYAPSSFSLHTWSHRTHPAGSSCALFAFPGDSTFHPPGPGPGPRSQASGIKKCKLLVLLSLLLWSPLLSHFIWRAFVCVALKVKDLMWWVVERRTGSRLNGS